MRIMKVETRHRLLSRHIVSLGVETSLKTEASAKQRFSSLTKLSFRTRSIFSFANPHSANQSSNPSLRKVKGMRCGTFSGYRASSV